MNVFCVFERYGGGETLAAVCENLAAAEAFVEQRRVTALEQDQPCSSWRTAEWPLLKAEEVAGEG